MDFARRVLTVPGSQNLAKIPKTFKIKFPLAVFQGI
jgi:hypothetical protein